MLSDLDQVGKDFTRWGDDRSFRGLRGFCRCRFDGERADGRAGGCSRRDSVLGLLGNKREKASRTIATAAALIAQFGASGEAFELVHAEQFDPGLG